MRNDPRTLRAQPSPPKSESNGYDGSDAILLERKDDMRRRGLPDDGDALALTFEEVGQVILPASLLGARHFVALMGCPTAAPETSAY